MPAPADSDPRNDPRRRIVLGLDDRFEVVHVAAVRLLEAVVHAVVEPAARTEPAAMAASPASSDSEWQARAQLLEAERLLAWA